MPLKLNISDKGKSWKLEVEVDILTGKSIGDVIPGKLLKPELEGYELEITGGTDFAGFPMSPDVEGIGMKGLLLTKGWGMWSKPKGDKKKQPRRQNGLRLRKTVRGRTISEKSMQINMKVTKEGSKKLAEVFPDQNKAPEPPAQEATREKPAEEKPQEAAAPAA